MNLYAVGIVACLQTHGSRANWHPHLHLLVTDGGFRPDGTFVSWPAHDTARLTEAFRRAVLRRFVRVDRFDLTQAAGMRTWPHSGVPVHTAVWIPEDDRAFATRLARYCGRTPVARERLPSDRAATTAHDPHRAGALRPLARVDLEDLLHMRRPPLSARGRSRRYADDIVQPNHRSCTCHKLQLIYKRL
jgi:hypothetical protein